MTSTTPLPRSAQPTLSPFADLPDELVHNILSFLAVQGLGASDSVSKRFNGLVRSSTAFRPHCVEQFRFWQSKHNFQERLKAPIGETNWRSLLAERIVSERHISQAFEEILHSQLGRIERLDTIVNYGSDAKDFLFRQLDTPADAEDFLSRTWWANVLLSQIERRPALDTLSALRRGNANISLERALACLDLLIVPNPPETLDQVDEHFDRIAEAFCEVLSRQGVEGQRRSPRQIATFLASYLHERRLLGIQPTPNTREYGQLQNTLISVALCERRHQSLPLISTAIYCAVARRVGLDAHPVNYPAHVYVVVSPSSKSDIDLDGDHSSEAGTSEQFSHSQHYMYLDPYNGSHEVSYEGLFHGLLALRLSEGQRRSLISPCKDVSLMLIRTANNLKHVTELMEEGSFSEVLQDVDYERGCLPPSVLNSHGLIRPVEIGDHLTILQAKLMIQVLSASNIDTQSRALTRVMEQALESRFLGPQLVRDLFVPLLPEGSQGRIKLEDAIDEYSVSDERLSTPKRRADIANISQEIRQHPRYPVGTYFMHKRYEYVGLVIGWDSRCDHSDEWIRQMQVDSLPHGRTQPFYNVKDGNGVGRYVAEENIGALGRWLHYGNDEGHPAVIPHRDIMRKAGEWMKRWDAASERFVSNLKDQYPDD